MMDECYTNSAYRVGKPAKNSQIKGCLESISFNNLTKTLTITPLCGNPLSTVIGIAGAGAVGGSDVYTVSAIYDDNNGKAQFTNTNNTSFELDLSLLKAGIGKYYAGAGITISNTNTVSLDTSSNPSNYIKTISLNGGAPLTPNGGNLNLNVSTEGGATGGVANQQDPITIVSTAADINALQALDSSGSQIMQYTGITGTLLTSFGSIYLVQGNTYSISDTNKICDLSTEVVSSAVYTGDFNGSDSEIVPVRTRNQNGLGIYQVAFHRTAGIVVAGNVISFKVNGLVVATLPLSASGNYSKIFTTVNISEGAEYSFTSPNNPSLAGIVYLYNVENSIN
jgi:hypothetical protein